MKTPEVLRKLVRACVDDERMLRHESRLVDAVRGEALTAFAHERAQFVVDLEELGKRKQSHDGSWRELAREVGRSMWVGAAGPNSGDAIATCRHSHSRTEASYDEALRSALPDEVRSVLTVHRHRLHDQTEQLNQLV